MFWYNTTFEAVPKSLSFETVYEFWYRATFETVPISLSFETVYDFWYRATFETWLKSLSLFLQSLSLYILCNIKVKF